MIKFKGYDSAKNTEFYGFGLSENNIKQLKLGNSIHINGDAIKSLYDYYIFYGITEEDIYNELKQFVGPDTTTNFQPEE